MPLLLVMETRPKQPVVVYEIEHPVSAGGHTHVKKYFNFLFLYLKPSGIHNKTNSESAYLYQFGNF